LDWKFHSRRAAPRAVELRAAFAEAVEMLLAQELETQAERGYQRDGGEVQAQQRAAGGSGEQERGDVVGSDDEATVEASDRSRGNGKRVGG
jgi:hypothetical protein